MSVAELGRVVGVRRASPGRHSHSLEGRHRAQKRRGWWYTASNRQRRALYLVSVAGVAVAGVVVSQLVSPFWWSSGSSGELSSSSNTTPLAAAPQTMDQQALWGLVTAPPGAPAAPVPAQVVAVTAPAAAATTAAAPIAPVAPLSSTLRPTIRHLTQTGRTAAPAVARVTTVAPAATSPAATSPAAKVNALVNRNLRNSGAARLLCGNNPSEASRLGLHNYCATVASPGHSPTSGS